MPQRIGPDMPWAIFKLREQSFAFAVDRLSQVIVAPEVARLPTAPDYVRGVFELRGRVIPLVDLRHRLGMGSALAEAEAFCQLLLDREQDHRRWLDELRRSVVEGVEFRLATDPHKCAFGKWYDSYHAPDPWIAGLLKKFDAPHKRIHALASKVKELLDEGRRGEIDPLFRNGADTLASMIKLFAELGAIIRQSRREAAAILTVSGRLVAATIDSVTAVERIALESLPPGVTPDSNGIVRQLGRRTKSADLVLILEPERLIDFESLMRITAAAS